MPLELLRDAVRRTGELTRDRPATGRTHDDADESAGTIGTDSEVLLVGFVSPDAITWIGQI